LTSEFREPIAAEVSLELLGIRVVQVLTRHDAVLNKQQKRVLQKAEEFLRQAARGDQTAIDVQFSATSSDDLDAALWAARASSEGSSPRFTTYLHQMADLLAVSRKGGMTDCDKKQLAELVEFFTSISELARDATPTLADVVTEG